MELKKTIEIHINCFRNSSHFKWSRFSFRITDYCEEQPVILDNNVYSSNSIAYSKSYFK